MNNAGNVRILVVEDDPGMQRFLKNTLQVQSYDVIETAYAGEALRVLRQYKPELDLHKVRKGARLNVPVLASNSG